eukprot:4721319-Alexandrium_andersonii.AAC.1
MVGYHRPVRMEKGSSVATWATARTLTSETPTRGAPPSRTRSWGAPTRAAARAKTALCSAR